MSDEQIPPPPPKLEQPRQGNSFMFASPRNQQERDAWAAERWVLNGWTYQQIADALQVNNKATAFRAVERGLHARREATEVNTRKVRAIQRARLERAHEAAMAVLEAEHITVSNGRVVLLGGEPVKDYDPILRTLDRIVKISESIRRLDGIDAPVKVDATVTEVTQQDIELQEMIREAKARTAREEQAIRGQAQE